MPEVLRRRNIRRGWRWHLDERRVVVSGVVNWLWRAVNASGEVLDVRLQGQRDTGAAKRFSRRLIDDHTVPERIVTDGLRSYGASLRELTAMVK